MILESSEIDQDAKQIENAIDSENICKVLCLHCGRTSVNGIKCIGKCVSDSEY